MNPEVKSQWIAALRSGKYTKGENQLRNGKEYCCLGVLCDLHSRLTGRGWVTNTYHGELLYLPDSVIEWAELESNSPKVIIDQKSSELSSLNDKGATFEELAKVIEERL